MHIIAKYRQMEDWIYVQKRWVEHLILCVCLCEWEFAICLFHENTHHVANRKEPLNNTIFSIGIEHVTYNRQTFQKKEKKANKSFPRNIPDCIKLMNFRCISKITNISGMYGWAFELMYFNNDIYERFQSCCFYEMNQDIFSRNVCNLGFHRQR